MEHAALILEGGAQRGVFTAGVLDFWMERGLEFPYIVSVSAGTCCALGYLSRQPGRTKACMLPSEDNCYYGIQQFRENRRIMDLRKVFFDYPYGKFPFNFDTYFRSPTEHEMVTTEQSSGQAAYFSVKSDPHRLSTIAMASCSMPVLNPPVEIDGSLHYDGGVSDSIPVGRAVAKGYSKVVAVLTRRAGVYPKSSPRTQAIYSVFFRQYPAFSAAMLSRPNRYRAQVAQLDRMERQGRAFLLRPEIPEIKHLEWDINVVEAYYQHGYETAARCWAELETFLAQPFHPASGAP